MSPAADETLRAKVELAEIAAGIRAHLRAVKLRQVSQIPVFGRRDETRAIAQLTGAEGEPSRQLAELEQQLAGCSRCRLCEGRRNVVFGAGDPSADLVFVGEAPGADEDRQGEPFVGAAGQLLTRMIVAMGLSREDVYICNIVKCRPPRNRNPLPDEVDTCRPFLDRQLAAISPRLIVALGTVAAKCLLQTDVGITQLRGRWHRYKGLPVMPTFHPAYILRNASAKRPVWTDLQLVMSELRSD